jgi:hypothetical protein
MLYDLSLIVFGIFIAQQYPELPNVKTVILEALNKIK